VEVYSRCEAEAWLSGYNPVLTAWSSGMFGDLRMPKSSQAVNGYSQAVERQNSTTLKRLFRLPPRLPAVLLPPAPELAALARSAPIMVKLEGLARWLGRDGRPVTRDDLLPDADAADAADYLGIRPELLPYLWEYALVSGWIKLVGEYGHRRWAVVGKTASRWADGDASGTLYVWATVFASVLTTTLEVSADQAPEAARWLNFQGQGVALAVILFLARRTGVTESDVSDIVQDGAISDLPSRRARRAWDAWVQQFGDPARRLLSELATLRAVVPPGDEDGPLTLSPLAQWALREQFKLDDIAIRLVLTSGELSIADLVALAGGISDEEFGTEFDAWSSHLGADRAAFELLRYASSANARARLTAISLVRRLGPAAGDAWLRAMGRPELRGYARMALFAMEAELSRASRQRLADYQDSDEWNWVAADLLSLIGGGDDPDPQQVMVLFADAVPAGQEGWVIRQMARGTDRDVRQVLEVLARVHPDPSIAREARKAARVAARKPRPLTGNAELSGMHQGPGRRGGQGLSLGSAE
jgi:hypothetical protein